MPYMDKSDLLVKNTPFG